ncbi:MAG: hypothetical protein WKF79_02820, partial [Nocardioides sp.]
MARKNPLGKLKDAALDTIKNPVSTAEKAVGAVTSLVPGRKAPSKAPAEWPAPDAPGLRAVPAGPPAEAAEASRKVHGDPVTPAPTAKTAVANKTVAKKAPAKKAAAKKTVAKKAPAKKAVAKKAVAKKAPAKKSTTPIDVTPADIAGSVAKQDPAK